MVLSVGLAAYSATAHAQTQTSSQSESLAFLDQRSRYGQDWFPQPLVAPNNDRTQQVRTDWAHSDQSDVVTTQVSANLDQFTLEAGLSYLHNHSVGLPADASFPSVQGDDGLDYFSLSARHPIYQFVSPHNFFDYTLVASFTVALPIQIKVNPDSQLIPRLSQLIRFGEHTSLQTSIGYSYLLGPEHGGTSTIEYNGVLGYSLDQDDLPLIGITCTTPLLELKGEQGLSGEDSGINRVFGTLGIRLNLHTIGNYRPRLGFGYTFPLNQEARDVFHWAVITSFVLEF